MMLENQDLLAAAQVAVLAGMFESAMDAIIAVDEQRRIILFNPAAETMFGWQCHEVMGQPFDRLIPRRLRSAYAWQLKRFIAAGGGPRRFAGQASALYGLRASTDEFPLEMSLSQQVTSVGKVITAMVRDISVQQASQAQLKLLETSVSHINDMVLITDAEPLNEPGQRIVFVNDAFVRHTGYSREEVLGRSPRFLQGALTQRHELDRLRSAFRQWQPVNAEVINYTKDGQAYWVMLDLMPVANARGHFTHWVCVQRDITERKRADQALAAIATENSRLLQATSDLNLGLGRQLAIGSKALGDQEALFRTLAEQAPQVIWTLDRQGQVTYLNQAWFDLMGGTLQDWTGRQLLATVIAEDQSSLRASWLQAQAGEQPFSGVRRIVCRDGSTRTMAYRAAPVRETTGAVIFWVGIDTDVTEFKKIEIALRQRNEDLGKSAQALRELTSRQMALKEVERQRIAHELHDELGQRLTVLRMDTGMLPQAAAVNSDQGLSSSVTRLKNQIDEILAVMRDLAGRLRPAAIDLGLSVATEALVENFQASLGIPCTLSDQLPAGLVLGEQRALGAFRILQESLTNVARHAQASLIHITLSVQDDQLLLRVQDDGLGFTTSTQLDQPSFGLSGMRERAAALGGRLEVTSQPGHGTTVDARLPLLVPLQPAVMLPVGFDPLARVPLV